MTQLEALETRIALLEQTNIDINRQLMTLQGLQGTLEQSSAIGAWAETGPYVAADGSQGEPNATYVGAAQMLLAGPNMRFERVARTPFLRLHGPATICYDYIVCAGGCGTHTTLGGTNGAFAAAVAAGGNKTIWMCNSETLTEPLSLNGFSTESIAIHGPVMHGREGTFTSHPAVARVLITAPTSQPLFVCSSANSGDNRLHFRNIGLISSNGAPVMSFNDADGNFTAITFENVYFGSEGASGHLLSATGLATLGGLALRLIGCSGDLKNLTNFSTLGGLDVMYIIDSADLRFTSFWNEFAGFATNSQHLLVDGGEISVGNTSLNNVNVGERIIVRNVTIRTPATVFSSSASTSQNQGGLFTFSNIDVVATGADAKFCNLGTAAVNSGNNLFIHGVRGMAGSHAVSGAFITVGSNWNNVYVADVYAPGWTTTYSGPASTNPVCTKFTCLPFEVEGNADGTDLVRLDSTGTSWATMAFQRSGATRGIIGLWNTTSPSPFASNDLYFATNDGTFRDIMAFANNGSAIKLNTSLRSNSYGYFGSAGFAAPANTTAGDLTATRFFVNNDSNFSLQFSGSDPRLVFAGLSYLQFTRASNRYDFVLGAVNAAELDIQGARFIGYLRVGSLSAPTNTSSGDVTVGRLVVGSDDAFGVSAYAFRVSHTFTDTATGAKQMAAMSPQIAPATDSASEFRALNFSMIVPGTTDVNFSGRLSAIYAEGVRARGSGNFTAVTGGGVQGGVNGLTGVGVVIDSSADDAGTVSEANGVTGIGILRASGGPFATKAVTLARGLFAPSPNSLNGVALGTYVGLDIEKTAVGTANIGLRNAGSSVYTPTTQAISAATNTLGISATVLYVTVATGGITLTSTPSISTTGAQDGQLLTVINTDSADALTLQDESVLAGSKLRLPGAANLVLGPRDSATFVYNAAAGEWYCIANTNL